mgnify:CR=1 FL=1
MTSDLTFIDTSGFYALLAAKDKWHQKAKQLMKAARSKRDKFITTDYVLDETATLLVARGIGHLANQLFDISEKSEALDICFIERETFNIARNQFLKNLDQGFSFTDCIAFSVMKQRKIKTALTSDLHFSKAGFRVLLS